MSKDSTVSVTEAQANLPKLLKRDSFAIARHGKIVGFYVSRERVEALIESMELLAAPDFAEALREFKAGRTEFRKLEEVEKELEL